MGLRFGMETFSSSSAVAAQVTTTESKSNIQFRALLRKAPLARVPTHQLVDTEIELTNWDATEPLIITKVFSSQEETKWTETDDSAAQHLVYWNQRRLHTSEMENAQEGEVDLRMLEGGGGKRVPVEEYFPAYWSVSDRKVKTSSNGARLPSSYRRQLHTPQVLFDQKRTVQVAPNQKARVPIAFLPRIPSQHESDFSLESFPTHRGPPKLYQRFMDRSSLPLLLNPRDNRFVTSYDDPNHRDPICYTVRTTITLETNRGIVRIPVTAQTVSGFERDDETSNEYGLPTVIVLDTTTELNQKNVLDDTGESFSITGQFNVPPKKTKNTTTYSRTLVTPPSDDCFDVFLRHPSARTCGSTTSSATSEDPDPVRVLEARLTDPSAASLYLRNDRSLTNQITYHEKKGPKMVIHDFTTSHAEGALYVMANVSTTYVVTVCAKPTPRIRHATAQHVDGLGLEKNEETEDEEEEEEKAEVPDDIFLIRPYPKSLGYLQIETSLDSLWVALEQYIPQDIELEMDGAPFFSESPSDVDDVVLHAEPRLLASVPESISQLFLMPNADDFTKTSSHRIRIGFQNVGRIDALQIKRALIMIDETNSNLPSSQNDALKFYFERIEEGINRPLEVGQELIDLIRLNCVIDWERYLEDEAQSDQPESAFSWSLEGALIVRAETVPKAPSMKGQNTSHCTLPPQRDVEIVTLEVPMSLEVRAGRVSVAMKEVESNNLVTYLRSPRDPHIIQSAFFPQTMAAVRSDAPQLQPKVMEHHWNVESNLAKYDMRLQTVYISTDNNSPLCRQFEASLMDDRPAQDVNRSNSILGSVRLRYRLPEGETNSLFGRLETLRNWTHNIPTLCYLKYRTDPDTGKHRLPLLIYPGLLDVAGSPTDPTVVPGGDTHSIQDAVVGLEELKKWIHSSKLGSSLRSVLLRTAERRNEPDDNLLRRFISGLRNPASVGSTLDVSAINPILLHAGAVSHDDVEVLPLYITNHNPVPVSLAIEVGEVEGFSISLGRDASEGSGDGNSLLDYLPATPLTETFRRRKSPSKVNRTVKVGPYEGHPAYGLKQFLLKSELAKYLNVFPFRDAVSRSTRALSNLPLLERLYAMHSRAHFHRTATARKTVDGNKCGLQSPSSYGAFTSVPPRKSNAGPLMLSSDMKKIRSLAYCSLGENTDKRITLPPGGVARFDVRVRSPGSDALDMDVTEFLSTGLILSTSFGELIPIMVQFEALQGSLAVSDLRSAATKSMHTIQVPIELFGETSDAASASPAQAVVIPSMLSASNDSSLKRRDKIDEASDSPVLLIQSSFSRDVSLKRLSSCNPWFYITDDSVQRQNSQFGVQIGSVKISARCDGSGLPSNRTEYRSFFRCALSWLLQKNELQPNGCGGTKSDNTTDRVMHPAIEIDRVLRTFKRAAIAAEASDFKTFIKTTSSKKFFRSSDGLVSLEVLKAAASAHEAWVRLSEAGLGRIGTSLRAAIEYNSTTTGAAQEQSDETHRLSVAIRNVTLESILSMPVLHETVGSFSMPLDKNGPTAISFKPTLLGDVSSAMIPIKNPSNVPVRVRLAVIPPKRGGEEDQTQATYRGYSSFLGDYDSPFIQTRQHPNLYDDATNLWWGQSGSFHHFSDGGDGIRSGHNVSIKTGNGAQFTLVNPSVMYSSAFLVGCGSRCGLSDDTTSANMSPFSQRQSEQSPFSPIGAAAAAGHTLVGHTLVGHTRDSSDASTSNDEYSDPAAFAVTFAALDEVIIPPFGTASLGPVLFRPPGKSARSKCASDTSKCATSTFESQVLIENTLTGVERVVLRGITTWQKILFFDNYDFEDLPSRIEMRLGKPTLMLPGTADVSFGFRIPEVKPVFIYNDGESPVTIERISLLSEGGRTIHNDNPCRTRDFFILNCVSDHVHLPPKHNHTVYVQHHPRCLKRKEFVTLRVQLLDENIAVRQQTFGRMLGSTLIHQQTFELDIGYHMSRSELRKCVPIMRSGDARYLRGSEAYLAGGSDEELAIAWKAPYQQSLHYVIILILSYATVVWFSSMMAKWEAWQKSSNRYHAILNKPHNSTNNLKETTASEMGKTWFSAFRCLARADPTSAELQTLGREQTRQIAHMRYRLIGATPPAYFTVSNMMQRESGGNSSRSSQMRTLGENLLGTFNRDNEGVTPCGLGWKVAVARQVIDYTSLDSCPIVFESENLDDSEETVDDDTSYDEELVELDVEHAESDDEEVFEDEEEKDESVDDVPDEVTAEPSIDIEQVVAKSSQEEENDAVSGKASQEKPIEVANDESIPASHVPVATASKSACSRSKPTTPPEIPNPTPKKGKAVKAVKNQATVTPKPIKDGKDNSETQPRDTKVTPDNRKSPSTADVKEPRVKAQKKVTVTDSTVASMKSVKQEAQKRATKKEPKAIAKASYSETKRTASARDKTKIKKVKAAATPPTNAWSRVANVAKAPSAPLVSSEASMLRPPPGLSPPPGFVDPKISEDSSTGAGATAPHRSNRGKMRAIATSYEPSSFTASRLATNSTTPSSTAKTNELPPLSTENPPPLPPPTPSFDQEPLAVPSQPVEAGFDVMAFLDDILNEGSTSAHDDLLGGSQLGSSPLLPPSIPGFSANPWATAPATSSSATTTLPTDPYAYNTTTTFSRAAAYGISIDDDDEQDDDENDNNNGSPLDPIPLLTPDVILPLATDERNNNNNNGMNKDEMSSFLEDIINNNKS